MGDYPVVDVSTWPSRKWEPLGTKRKVWLQGPDGALWLFKYRHKPTTGDDWAEKIAAEVAALLAIPHAEVELATLRSEPGVIVKDFTAKASEGDLILGNALLLEEDPSYPADRPRYRVAHHTVARVLEMLAKREVAPPSAFSAEPDLGSAGGVFTGYLLLDALIGNQDRHHENWGVLYRQQAQPLQLTPSFDHASSLGQILTDEERRKRLGTRDAGYGVQAYARRGRSALYRNEKDDQPMTTLEAMEEAGRTYDRALETWRGRLRRTPLHRLRDAVAFVPDARMSTLAKRFATALLECNRTSIVGAERP